MEANLNLSVYWTLLKYGEWNLFIAATSKGLCYVGSQKKPFEECSDWVKSRLPGSVLVQDDAFMQPYSKEIIEYFQGNRKSFNLPLDFTGTPFQLEVWKALREIPFGLTESYSEIANRIGKPASVRAVGSAIGANPVLITIPCHRVIGKNGSLTGYRGGLEMKTQLLQLEREPALVDRSKQHV